MVKDTFKFKSGYQIKLSLTKKSTQIQYSFIDNNNSEYFVKIGEFPTSLSSRSAISTEIKTCLNPDKPTKVTKEELRKVYVKLQKIVSALQGQAEVQKGFEENEKNLERRKKVHEAKKVLKELHDPLLYIGSICDWLSAGERINILICFVAGCSQIILKNPVSVIGYGESSSGKTHVEQVAVGLFPPEFVVNEKQVSPSALFNRSKESKTFYDGKIVYYGDMGGQKDRDNLQETMDLMKELQTDGFLSKPVSVKGEDGNWITEELKLKGKPSLWYTTVPTFIDSQETSRAIIFSPRTDNRDIFHKRGKLLSLKKGKTYSLYEEVKELSELVPYFILHLREVMEDYIIINPYYEVISTMLKQSKYYKRDSEKYFNMLNTITAINFYQNKKYVFEDGQKAVITSKNDVALFLSMLEGYMGSISINIKPKAVEVYKTFKANVEDWKLDKEDDDDGYASKRFHAGITANDFFEHTDMGFSSVRSVQKYFKDLYDAGLLKKVGSENRATLYDINDLKTLEIIEDIDIDSIIDNVESELGEDISEIILTDTKDEDLKITNKHERVVEVVW
ncbi:MAG: hypothetical protein IJF83_10820 [Methanobrevibacter sp.]|nr:hypothetical protein [Methanobrevibacter sp.]